MKIFQKLAILIIYLLGCKICFDMTKDHAIDHNKKMYKEYKILYDDEFCKSLNIKPKEKTCFYTKGDKIMCIMVSSCSWIGWIATSLFFITDDIDTEECAE